MKPRLLFALLGSIWLIATGLLAQGPSLPSFTAQSVQTTPDQPDKRGVITKSGSMMRLEFTQGGQEIIQIFRPTEGLTLTLFPANQTYYEIIGPSQPEEVADQYAAPCPPEAEENGLQCTRLGLDTVSNIPVERWHIGSNSESSQMLILWDTKRKRALRQEMSNGTVVQMIFLEMQEIAGRNAEHWVTEISRTGTATLRNDWWYDLELQLVLQETLPGGIARRLENISVGAVDPSLFTVPDGWQRAEAPNSTNQE